MGFFDFFKPQWKHSDPAIRAAAIRHLHDEQQEIFLELALQDADAANRLAAARRITDSGALRRLRDGSKDRNLRDLAQRGLIEGLTREALAAKEDADGLAKAKAALDEIGEEHHLVEDIATEASSLKVRRLALDRLIHPGALLNVAQNETDTDLALAAFQRITRENHLESLAKQAKNREVKRLAKERLKEIEKGRQPDEAAVNRQKMALLLGVVDKAAAASADAPAHFPWKAAHEQVVDAENSLAQLLAQGVVPPKEQVARFRDQAALFHDRHDVHSQEERKRQERALRETAARSEKETLCAELEALAASGHEDAAAGAQLRDRFEHSGFAGESDDELNRRFRQAFDRHERERLGRIREREDAGRRHRQESEARERIAELAEAAGELAGLCAQESQATPDKASDGRLHAAQDRLREFRRDWNKYFPGSASFPEREGLAARFEAAAEALEKWLEERRALNLGRMEEFLPEMEALAESGDFSQAERRFRELNSAWRQLQPAPQGPEAEALATRFRVAADRFREAQDWLRWSNLRAKQEVCQKLEALAEGEDRKAMFQSFKEMQESWKATGPVPWDASEALWDRYHQVCDKLYEKLKEYFAELDEERESHLKAKEEICARLESLVQTGELDWREGTEAVKEAQAHWKTLGAVPKDKAEALWLRFKAATSAFFDRKDGWLGDNLAKKNELVALAESLQDSTEWKTTSAAIKEAQEKWKTIGPVPRSETEALWLRFHTACEKFFAARRAFFEKLEADRPVNLAKKQELCALVEALEQLPTDQERYQRIIEAQAAWKDVGPAPRELEDALWERFRKPIDGYFQGRKARLEDEHKRRDENARAKEEICAEAESVADSTDWKSTVERIKSLQARWRAVGPAPREKDKELWNRFRTACDGFFDRLKQNAQRRDAEREGNLRRKEDLCFSVEGLVNPADSAQGADRDWKAATEEVKELQREWKNIGPVPKEKSEALWDRFHLACDAFFEERRRALGLREEDPQVNLEGKLALIGEADQLAANPGEHQVSAIIQLRRNWKRIGPVPRAQSDYVWKRFNTACEQAAGGAFVEDQGDGGEGMRRSHEPQPTESH